MRFRLKPSESRNQLRVAHLAIPARGKKQKKDEDKLRLLSKGLKASRTVLCTFQQGGRNK